MAGHGKLKEARQLLPRDAYTSAAWFRREQDELFGRCWQFAGLATELTDPGDYRTLQVGRYPLFVVRDRDGAVRAFHNICRHRGSLLLEGHGNTGDRIRCPYHYWTYGLEGGLRTMPARERLYPDLDRSAYGLRPASLETFRGLLFVSPQVPPHESFAEWLGDLGAKAWPHAVEDMREVLHLEYDLKANWKLFYENAMDGYHLAYLHARTLGGPDPAHQDWDAAGRHGIFISSAGPRPRGEELLEPIEGAGDGRYGSVYYLFPNFGTLPGPRTWTTFHVIPVSPSRTRIDTRFFVSKDSDRAEEYYAESPDLKALRDGAAQRNQPLGVEDLEGHAMESGSFHFEDMWQVERMQRAIESPVFEVGPMAPIVESQLTFFQRNLLDYVPLDGDP